MSSADRPPLQRRHVVAVVLGNALEFYDFVTYAYFAIYIGEAYFPSDKPITSLLASLAAFGAGFATRPIGGIVLGTLGDRWGRRPAMYLSFALMGVGMLGVALTPSYASIGVAAPVLLMVARLLQGFALGGEVGPTTAFLVEAPPPERRGFYGSLQSGSQFLATLAAGIVGSFLAAVLSPEALAEWGWRVAFLLGGLIIPVGLIIRRSLPETMHVATAGEPPHEGDHWRTALLGLLVLGSATISTYVILSLATYAQATLHMSARWAFLAALSIGVAGSLGAPIGGALSDRIGRKPVMIAGMVPLTLAGVPAFLALNATHSGVVLLALSFAMAFLLAFFAGVMIMALSELLPPKIRSGAMAIVYAVAIAVFGGSTQYITVWLTDRLQNPLAPGYYMTVALCIGIVAVVRLRESAPVKAGA